MLLRAGWRGGGGGGRGGLEHENNGGARRNFQGSKIEDWCHFNRVLKSKMAMVTKYNNINFRRVPTSFLYGSPPPPGGYIT